jgi:hypothetical protein
LSRVAYRIKTERRQASRLPAFLLLIYATGAAYFFYAPWNYLLLGAAFKSRRRKTTRQIVRRGKLYGFRVVNHARPIAELISVPLTDDHLDL